MDGSWTVAVRTLCAFTDKQGDLDLRFTPAPTAQEGIEGHALVAGRRPASWQPEVSLTWEGEGVRLRGRADGWDPLQGRLEEIKTHKGALELQPASHRALHWAQLRTYGAMLCADKGLPRLILALVYFDIGSQQETVLTEEVSAEALMLELLARVAKFKAWAQQEAGHRVRRDELLARLNFPHAEFRAGQRVLAESVYRAAAQGRCLLAQAPTGIGKTVGTLFPMLKAMPTQRLDKIWALTAKTAGRLVMLQTLARLRMHAQPKGQGAASWRVLELVARDKACVHPDKACHGESCELAKGFYDRLGLARQAAVLEDNWHHAALQRVAQAHGICPYYLAQDLVRWADVVVGDVNYWFDQHAMLYALTQADEWRVAVLVDEAHNLIDRGRAMYSSSLSQLQVRGLQHEVPMALQRAVSRVVKAWRALNQSLAEEQTWVELPTLPTKWLGALQQSVGDISAWLADHPAAHEPALQSFYLDALALTRLAESFGPHSMVDLSSAQGAGYAGQRRATDLTIRNVLPAVYLTPRFAAAQSVVLFSATLQPPEHHLRLLGLPDNTVYVSVPTPFKAAQLTVKTARQISTRWADRSRSLPTIVRMLHGTYLAHPGNHLAFFSSYDYLQQVADAFQQAYPDVPVWRQARRMTEAEQVAFLDRFVEGGKGMGFAVLGGAFGEGVDLPGTRLVGASIATLGLPQVNPVNEAMRLRLDALLGPGQGYDAVYLYPGIQKVVQAAGRVIRTATDQGVVMLMDDRYTRAVVRKLLPDWWQIESA